MSIKFIPLDSYLNKVSNDIFFMTYFPYFIDQINGQSVFLNYVRACQTDTEGVVPIAKKSIETEHLLDNKYPKHPSMYIGQKLWNANRLHNKIIIAQNN